ncbi:MAG: hypothetical protein GX444_11265 [Myxococcales bacterium]|nr:hypothetical protein [Myxococcales bacterium]
MLDIMRRHSKSKLIKILLLSVALSFIIGFGAMSYVTRAKRNMGRHSGNDEMTWAAKVNGVPISVGLLARTERYLDEMYRKRFGEMAEMLLGQVDLGNMALNQLIGDRVMEVLAANMGLTVTTEEIADQIYRDGRFLTNGRFDRDRYLQMLRRQKIAPKEFENDIRRSMLSSKLRELVFASVKVTDDEVRSEFEARADQVDLRFVKIMPKDVTAAATPTDEQVKAHFDAAPDKFKVPEKRKINYILCDAGEYEKEVTLTDAQVQEYYEANKEKEFKQPEQVHARHILIKSEPATDAAQKEAARLKAESLRLKLQNGGDFAELAKANSDDPGSKDKNGDLGWFGRGRMVKTFEDTAFSLEPNKISEVVESPFGYHIIEVLEKKPESVIPLADVTERIKNKLKTEEGLKLAKADAEKLYAKIKPDTDLLAFGKTEDKKVGTSSAFSAQQPVPGIPRGMQATRQVFEMKEKEISQPLEAGNGVYIMQLAAVEPEHLPQFEEVQADVRKDLETQLEQQAMLEKGKALIAQLQAGKSLEVVASGADLTVDETGPFARNAKSIPKIGAAPELQVAAFDLTAEKPILPRPYVSGKGVTVAVLKERQLPKPEDFTAQQGKIREELVQRKAELTLQAWMEQAEKTIQIERNQQVLDLMKERMDSRRKKQS